jgi:class 3 adenylate cyclase/tetratricopeptide (TPR) repeat protein
MTVEGERKQVTVLFVDIVGSTSLAAELDPEAWTTILDGFLAVLAEGVERFEGTVEQFTGDGIMALFGAPVAQEDHARRACHAALQLRDDVHRFADELRRAEGLELSVRMGLNSGEVVVGGIADDHRHAHTALGHTVNLAQRMESLARPGAIYASAHTAALVGGYFELTELGGLTVKGLAEPVAVFELAREGTLRTPLEVAATRGFSPFVGRESELAAIERALERAVKGEPQVIGVSGEAGVGKSRLCHEVARACRRRGLEVWEAHGLAHTKSVPLVPVLEILRSFFEISEADDAATARGKVERTLLELDPGLGEFLTLVFDLLGIADPERPAPRIDPDARQRQLFDALNRLVLARGRRTPGIILAEDLHWLDPATEAFLANLVEGLAGTRTLLLVNFRPEYRAPWMRGAHYVGVTLAPLDREASGAVLGDLLGDDPSLDGLVEVIHERTGGNPFFIEEVVRTLAEGGTLEGGRSAYRLSRTIATLTLPPTVQAVLAARIDRLGAREKEVLQAAAVIGREFTAAVVGEVTGLRRSQLARALRALVAAGFLRAPVGASTDVYEFTHPLTEEVAYRSQLGARRARTHAAVADATERASGDRLDERAALLAHHWEAAGDAAAAARWSARAAGWAGYNDPFEAARHWRKVRVLTADLEETAESVGLAVGARAMILNFGWRLGRSEGQDVADFEHEMAEVFAEGRALAERHDQIAAVALLLTVYAGLSGVTGRVADGVRLSREALEVARGTGDPALEVTTLMAGIHPLYLAGRLRDALEVTRSALALLEGTPGLAAGLVLASPRAFLLNFQATLLLRLGRVAEAKDSLRGADDAAREDADPENAALAHMTAVAAGDFSGEVGDVLTHAQEGAAIAERAGGPFLRGYAQAWLGYAHVIRHDWAQAVVSLENALDIFRARLVGLDAEPFALTALARAYLASGDLTRASRAAEDAVELACRRGTRIWELGARHQRGRVLLADARAGSVRAAEAELRHALALVEETEARCYEPQVRLDLAEVAHLRGDARERGEELRRAERSLSDMGVPAPAAGLVSQLDT